MDEYISWSAGQSTNKPCVKEYGCYGEVRYVSDPFQAEINDRIENIPICESCYKSLLGDI